MGQPDMGYFSIWEFEDRADLAVPSCPPHHSPGRTEENLSHLSPTAGCTFSPPCDPCRPCGPCLVSLLLLVTSSRSELHLS